MSKESPSRNSLRDPLGPYILKAAKAQNVGLAGRGGGGRGGVGAWALEAETDSLAFVLFSSLPTLLLQVITQHFESSEDYILSSMESLIC